MKRSAARLTFAIVASLVAFPFAALANAGESHDIDPLAWPEAGAASRPWAYWWWMGSAVDRENISRELARYRDAGMGGVHIIPIYQAKGWEDRAIPYLSPKWMEMMSHAVAEARRLGMDADMTTGTGWCFGGPDIPEELATQRFDIKSLGASPGKPPDPLADPGRIVATAAAGPDGKAVDLKDRIGPDGKVDWSPPGEGWAIHILWARPSGQKVKRAAPGGEGFMLNPIGGAAIARYLGRFTEAFAAHKGPVPRAMYHDSFEYSVDWSPEILEEFARRRGYSLTDELPAFAGRGDPDRVARVKCDYRETVSDLLVEKFLPAWTGWCRERGILTRNQAHGSPGNLLDLYAAADIPETEMFRDDRDILVSKFASSAAHVAGRRLVAAETGTWLAEHFNETLADLKRLADEMFAAGVNHVVYHGTCYSPDEAAWPGWLFYASTQMNPRNPIWRDAPALNAYLSRCQSVLQAGSPDNDVLVYWPIHDLWHDPAGKGQSLTVHSRGWLRGQPIGRTADLLWKKGFAFDYVSDRLLAGVTVEAGVIRAPGGKYRSVLVPWCRSIPLATMEKLVALATAGGTMIFEDGVPSDVPGLGDLAGRRAALGALLGRLGFGRAEDGGVHRATPGAGRILCGPVEVCLAVAGVPRETACDAPGVLLIRRAIPGGRAYFIANHGKEALVDPVLAFDAAAAAVLDPMTGRTGIAETRGSSPGATGVSLRLEPGESIIIRALTAPAAGPRWRPLVPAGEPVEVVGPWKVEFLAGGPEIPKSFTAPRLASWTDLGGDEAKRFGGTARYSAEFDAPPGGGPLLLDLGRVAESARVRVNGKDLGTLFAPPFRIAIDEPRPRANLLEVEVTNLAANRIRDLDIRKVPWKAFHDINIVNQSYRPFDASGWPVRESGLIGPVRLRRIAP
jgi:hypothetical protein